MPRAQQSKRYRSLRRGVPACKLGPAYSPEQPVAGCYRIRLRKGGPFAALRIWLGPTLDPETGEEMENRGYRWQARLNGSELVPIGDHWPGCARDPISEGEHDRLCQLSRTMDPDHPFFDPKKPINRLKSPMPF